jgi:hypothetical protein
MTMYGAPVFEGAHIEDAGDLLALDLHGGSRFPGEARYGLGWPNKERRSNQLAARSHEPWRRFFGHHGGRGSPRSRWSYCASYCGSQ